MTRQIDADALLSFLALLSALDPKYATEPGYSDRDWALMQVYAYVTALVEPQPTFREIEAADNYKQDAWEDATWD